MKTATKSKPILFSGEMAETTHGGTTEAVRSPTEKDLQRAIRHMPRELNKAIVATNIKLLDSPWECDAICVRKSGYWIEYEVKLSVQDFRADFQKKLRSWVPGDHKKHELYAEPRPIDASELIGTWHKYIVPKPAEFYFVCPEGLIKHEMVPSHCGLLTFDGQRLNTAVSAPRLKKATKLSYGQLFNIAAKVA